MDENRQNAIRTSLASESYTFRQFKTVISRFSAVRYDNDIWMIGGELSGSRTGVETVFSIIEYHTVGVY